MGINDILREDAAERVRSADAKDPSSFFKQVRALVEQLKDAKVDGFTFSEVIFISQLVDDHEHFRTPTAMLDEVFHRDEAREAAYLNMLRDLVDRTKL